MQQEDEGGRNCGVEEWGFPREKIRRIETEQVSTRGELYEIITTIKINQGSIHEGGFSGHAQRWELGVQSLFLYSGLSSLIYQLRQRGYTLRSVVMLQLEQQSL